MTTLESYSKHDERDKTDYVALFNPRNRKWHVWTCATHPVTQVKMIAYLATFFERDQAQHFIDAYVTHMNASPVDKNTTPAELLDKAMRFGLQMQEILRSFGGINAADDPELDDAAENAVMEAFKAQHAHFIYPASRTNVADTGVLTSLENLLSGKADIPHITGDLSTLLDAATREVRADLEKHKAHVQNPEQRAAIQKALDALNDPASRARIDADLKQRINRLMHNIDAQPASENCSCAGNCIKDSAIVQNPVTHLYDAWVRHTDEVIYLVSFTQKADAEQFVAEWVKVADPLDVNTSEAVLAQAAQHFGQLSKRLGAVSVSTRIDVLRSDALMLLQAFKMESAAFVVNEGDNRQVFYAVVMPAPAAPAKKRSKLDKLRDLFTNN